MARFEDAPHMSDDSCERGRHDDRGRGHDDCDGVWLELVLRDVDVTLSEAEVAAAGDFCTVTRMVRAGSIDGSRPPKPLPLVRATCETAEQRARLLVDGLYLHGRKCTAEVPVAPATGSAALGKRPPVDVPGILRLHAVAAARLVPARPTEGGGGGREETKREREKEGGRERWVERGGEGEGKTSSGPLSPGSRLGAAKQPEIVVCAETPDYHAVASATVGPSDCVLEIGSDLGALCALAWPLCSGRLVGVDLAELSISRARAAFPYIRFERIDALQVGSSQALRRMAAEVRAARSPLAHREVATSSLKDDVCKRKDDFIERKDDAAAPGEASVHGPSFTHVFIDINGNRPLPAVAGVLQMVLEELRAGFVCCKSRELHAALTAQCKKGPRCNIDL